MPDACDRLSASRPSQRRSQVGGKRHPPADAAERLGLVVGEPPQPGRPVGRMDPAARPRVDGAFVEPLAQRLRPRRALRVSLHGITAVTARPCARRRRARLCQNAAIATASTRVVTPSSAPSIACATARSIAAGGRLDAAVAAGPPAVADLRRPAARGCRLWPVERRRGSRTCRYRSASTRGARTDLKPPDNLAYDRQDAGRRDHHGRPLRDRRRRWRKGDGRGVPRAAAAARRRGGDQDRPGRDRRATRTARERFLRESRACAQLRHPNIVSILDYNLDAEGRPFLVMELLNGRSLRAGDRRARAAAARGGAGDRRAALRRACSSRTTRASSIAT